MSYSEDQRQLPLKTEQLKILFQQLKYRSFLDTMCDGVGSNSFLTLAKDSDAPKPLLNDPGSNCSAAWTKDLGTTNLAYVALNGPGHIDLAEILEGHATAGVLRDGTGSVILSNRTDKQRVVLFTRHR